MLKNWHKEDVFDGLGSRGWDGPFPLDVDSYFVGEAYKFVRRSAVLKLFFVADIGAGFEGKNSIEAIWAHVGPREEKHELWLHRTRDAKWKKELHDWAEQLSSPVKSV